MITIRTPSTFALGFLDTTSQEIQELTKDVSFNLNPFEEKVITLYLYGTSITNNSTIDVEAKIISLYEDTITVKTSFDNTSYISGTSSTSIKTNVQYVPLYIKLINNLFNEVRSKVSINCSLFYGEYLSEMSYSTLSMSNGWSVLNNNISTTPSRILNIIFDNNSSLLLYSNGESMILLTEDKGIKYGN